MGLTADYTVATKVAEKNRAFEGIFQTSPAERPEAVQTFVKAAQTVLKSLEGEGSTPSYAINAQDIKVQTQAIIVTDRGNKGIRECLKEFAVQFGLNLN